MNPSSRARSRTRYRVVAAVSTVLLLTAVTAAMSIHIGNPGSAAPAALTLTGPTVTLVPATSTLPLTAQDRLRDLADHITVVPTDGHVGDFDYVHVELWARSSNVVSRFDTRKWWRADGSGRIIERRLPDRPALAHQPYAKDRQAMSAAPATVEDFPAGRLAGELPPPIPSSPAMLLVKLGKIVPPVNGPHWIAVAIGNVHHTHYLDRDQRAAILYVLAMSNDVTYQGQTTDVAGRIGLTWAIATPTGTELLTFEPTTGQLLTHQSLSNTAPPVMYAYELFLDRDRVAHPAT